jgi:hypothetical protein
MYWAMESVLNRARKGAEFYIPRAYHCATFARGRKL